MPFARAWASHVGSQLWRKWTPFPSGHQLPVALQRGVGAVSPSPICAESLSDLILPRSCAWRHSHGEVPVSCCSFGPANTILQQLSTPSGSYSLPALLSAMIPEPRGERKREMDAPYRAEHHSVSCSLHLDLWWELRVTLICGYKGRRTLGCHLFRKLDKRCSF